MTDWKKEMNREADGLEWSHRCGWDQGVADTLAVFCDLRIRYAELHLVVPTFAGEFDALLKSSGRSQPPSGLREDPVADRGEGVPHATPSDALSPPTFLGGEGRALIEQAEIYEQRLRRVATHPEAGPEWLRGADIIRGLLALLTVSGAAHQEAEKEDLATRMVTMGDAIDSRTAPTRLR